MELAHERHEQQASVGEWGGEAVMESKPWEPEWRRDSLLRPELLPPPIRAGSGATQRMRGSEDARQRAFRSILTRIAVLHCADPS